MGGVKVNVPINKDEEASNQVTMRELMRLPVNYEPARNAHEQAICAAFSKVLRVVPVGRNDEFYDLGGDSLAGEALSVEIQTVTGKVFPISRLFHFATPAAIAQFLGGAVDQDSTGARFFVVHGRGGYTSLRPEFRAGLKADRKLTMFELPGIRGDREPIWNIRELARIYVDQIHAEQPQGQVHLAAFCSGSFIALEMADLLREDGRPLERLVLIDPLVPAELKARHEVERALEQRPGSVSDEQYFKFTGRWRDPALDAATVRDRQERMAKLFLSQMGEGRMAFMERYAGLGFADWPRAVLMTLYCHAWPRPFTGQAFLLASKQRIADMTHRSSIWRRFTPKLKVAVLSERHDQLGKGTVGTRTAAKLEEAMAAPV